MREFNAEEIKKRINAGLTLVASNAAQDLEGYAKANRPWTDRTGNARNSIKGSFNSSKNIITIALSGNVNYFEYLELSNERAYSILKPTMDIKSAEIIKSFKDAIK